MAVAKGPRLDLAAKTLPAALFESLLHIFAQNLSGVALVGGTALAGFYIGHRRSDDLDLFVRGSAEKKACVLAAQTLVKINATIREEFQTNQYYHGLYTLRDHTFTVDIVLDENIFKVGAFVTLENKVCVAELNTLFKTKIATLVSRCSEKDLYDLLWLLPQFGNLGAADLLNLGREIDIGLTYESLLLSLSGSDLQKDACGFAEQQGVDQKIVFEKVARLQKELLRLFSEAALMPPDALDASKKLMKDLIQRIRKWDR